MNLIQENNLIKSYHIDLSYLDNVSYNNVDELEMIQNETGCKLTIDTGHANTCNNLVEMLNLKNISYCHLNDNDGLHDQHITLGEGTLDLNLLKKIDNGVIELNNFENVLKSKTVINNL